MIKITTKMIIPIEEIRETAFVKDMYKELFIEIIITL